MASYFTLPLQHDAAAEPTNDKQIGKMSLLSPQISMILDDMEADGLDSSSDEDSLSDHADSMHSNQDSSSTLQQQKQENKPYKSSSLSSDMFNTRGSLNRIDVHKLLQSTQPKGAKSAKSKLPHMARFHSLRSMLFSASIEDKIKSATKEDCLREKTAASKWKEQHEQRQMQRPKTPEKDHLNKGCVVSEVKTKHRRTTSKDLPTMSRISENRAVDASDHVSAASSITQGIHQDRKPRHEDDEEASARHSNAEYLERRAIKHNQPGDSETGKSRETETDGGDQSLRNSDVDNSTRRVSVSSDYEEYKLEGPDEILTEPGEGSAKALSLEGEEVDNCVYLTPRTESPKAGSARQLSRRGTAECEEEQYYGSDTIKTLDKWISQQDEISEGSESELSPHASTVRAKKTKREKLSSRSSSIVVEHEKTLDMNDVNELVQWISRKKSNRQNAVLGDKTSSEVAQ